MLVFKKMDTIVVPIRNISNSNAKRIYQIFNLFMNEHRKNKKLFIIKITNRFKLYTKKFKD